MGKLIMDKPSVVSNPEKRISRRLFDSLSNAHRRDIKALVGKILTVVDSVTHDEIQRKAIKDIMQDVIYRHSSLCDDNIRYYTEHLASVLKENCDWVIRQGEPTKFNPLTD